MRDVLERPRHPDTVLHRVRTFAKRAAGEVVQAGWAATIELGAIGPHSRRARRFGRFGDGSVICFPPNALFNEQYISIGEGTMFGPQITLSAGMVPGQRMVSDTVITVGDRCLFGKGSGIVGHLEIVVGDDVWTGHHVYITDQNHGYDDLDLPISRQVMPERPCRSGVGRGSDTAPSCCRGRRSAGTWWWARTASSPVTCPTTVSPPVSPPASSSSCPDPTTSLR